MTEQCLGPLPQNQLHHSFGSGEVNHFDQLFKPLAVEIPHTDDTPAHGESVLPCDPGPLNDDQSGSPFCPGAVVAEHLVGYFTFGAAVAHMGWRKGNAILNLEMADIYRFKEFHGSPPS